MTKCVRRCVRLCEMCVCFSVGMCGVFIELVKRWMHVATCVVTVLLNKSVDVRSICYQTIANCLLQYIIIYTILMILMLYI